MDFTCLSSTVSELFSAKLPQKGVLLLAVTINHLTFTSGNNNTAFTHTALPKLLFLRLTMTAILLNLEETSILKLGQVSFLQHSSHYFHYSRALFFIIFLSVSPFLQF